ncbi:MAG TPA: RNA methyltransferase [Burkholderiales bacterium]|nr:RNA methyltransferase [Burkholderiales bacterium]
MKLLRSRDNPQVRRWRRLMRDRRLRRREARALIEGLHLVEAFLERGGAPVALLASERALERADVARLVARSGLSPVVMSDAVFEAIADAEAPVGIAAEIPLPAEQPSLAAAQACVFLEGIQDMGNLGAILRVAAGFDVHDVVLARGCADAWAPKTLRAGMGAHFALRILQVDDLAAAMDEFAGRIVCAVAHGGRPLAQIDLTGRAGLVFGAEGQGVSAATAARAAERATIPLATGIESLNVAAAAAICLYERVRQLRTGASQS